MSSSPSRHRSATLALIALLFAPLATADAQLGGLVKKAARKAAEDAAAAKVTGSTKANSTMVPGDEITADTFDLVLQGLTAVAAKMDASESAYKRRDALESKRSAHRSAHASERERYNLATTKTRDCYDAHFDGLREKRDAQARQKMASMVNSPEKLRQFSEDYSRLSFQMQEAQARGDSTAANRLLQAFSIKYLGADPQADSAAARTTCGVMPPLPAALAEEDRLSAEVDAANEELRKAEAATELAGPAASGLSAARFALARERLVTWYEAEKAGTASKKFPAREHQLFASRKAELDRVAKALR